MEETLNRLLDEQSRKTDRLDERRCELHDQIEVYSQSGVVIPNHLKRIMNQIEIDFEQSIRLELRWVSLLNITHSYGYITGSS
jgi:hypothetical protein